MAKRSDTKETVLLALELLRRIPRNSKISTSDLHQQLLEKIWLKNRGLCPMQERVYIEVPYKG